MDIPQESGGSSSEVSLGPSEKFGMEITCAIKIEANGLEEFVMGFFMSKTHILTCARPLWPWRNGTPKISARKLTEEIFYDVKLVNRQFYKDLALLSIVGVYESEKFGTLADYEDLRNGEKIYTFANAPGAEETYLSGSVACSCVYNMLVDNMPSQYSTKCVYYCYDWQQDKSRFRKLGNFWNLTTLPYLNDSSFGDQLLSELPVIECRGFKFGNSCEGSPVFNKIGKIVGMFVKGSSWPIALHVSVLSEYWKFCERFR